MSILDKYTNNLLEDEESEETSGYTTPAVLREDKEGLTLKKSFWISVLLHPSAVGAVWLITLILMLLGFNMHLFDKPKPKVNNIEFVLVDKEALVYFINKINLVKFLSNFSAFQP